MSPGYDRYGAPHEAVAHSVKCRRRRRWEPVKERVVEHWGTTVMGLLGGGSWVVSQISQAAGCTTPLTEIRTWLPAVLLAVVGAYIKGHVR